MKNRMISTLIRAVIFLLFLAGCEEFNRDPVNVPSEEPGKKDVSTGALKMYVCDDPFPISEIESAQLTFIRADVRIVSDSSEDEYITVFEDTMVIDLLTYRNGLKAVLGEIELDTGVYDQIRLYVSKAKLVLKNENRMFLLKVPSGESSGIKVFPEPALRIGGGMTTEVLLDFNLDKSFILKGSPDTPAGIKGFSFKPVLRVAILDATGTIEGTISDTEANLLNGVSVWIESDSVVSKTYSDFDGYYALPGIPPGNYDLYAASVDHDTVSKSVGVVAGMTTVQKLLLNPIQSE